MARLIQGYFTWPKEAYCILDNKGHLGFYYDRSRYKRGGEQFLVPIHSDYGSQPLWTDSEVIVTAAFVSTFAQFTRLESLACWFAELNNLQSVDGLKYLKTSHVTSLEGMFDRCYSLTHLDLRGFDTRSVSNMKDMFYNCSSIHTILCTDTWKCEDSKGMFYACLSLIGAVPYDENHEDVSMANPTTGYFATPEEEPSDRLYAIMSADSTLTFYYDRLLHKRLGYLFHVPEDGDISNEEHSWVYSGILRRAVFDLSFANYDSLQTLNGWFDRCSNLVEVIGAGNINTEYVTSMQAMFFGCTSLEILDLSGLRTDRVTDMAYMFAGNPSLRVINLSDFHIGATTSTTEMFLGCTSLQTIFCPSTWNSDANTEKMFEYCTSLNGAVPFDPSLTDGKMANPTTGYFTVGSINGIASMNTASHSTPTYDLMGRRVIQHMKGIYIRDRRKIVYK